MSEVAATAGAGISLAVGVFEMAGPQAEMLADKMHEYKSADWFISNIPKSASTSQHRGAAQRPASAAWRGECTRPAQRRTGEPGPAWLGAPISHVSCMRSLAGSMPQENRQH